MTSIFRTVLKESNFGWSKQDVLCMQNIHMEIKVKTRKQFESWVILFSTVFG